MSIKIRKLLGQKIRRVRTDKEISQEELAFISGLHRTYISEVERGIRNVSIDNIYKISKALDISLKDLFDFN